MIGGKNVTRGVPALHACFCFTRFPQKEARTVEKFTHATSHFILPWSLHT